MTDKLVNHLNERAERKAAEEEKRKKDAWKAILLCLVLVVGGFFALLSMSGLEKKESAAEEAELQKNVVQIEEDIKNGDYDSALIKANTLHYTSDYSRAIKKKWDSTRESLIALIKESQEKASKEAEAKIPSDSKQVAVPAETPAPTLATEVTQPNLDETPTDVSASSHSDEIDGVAAETQTEASAPFSHAHITAEELKVRTATDYAHTKSDIVYLGNNEGVTITIAVSKENLSPDDFAIIYDETALSADTNLETMDGKTIYTLYATGRTEGRTSLVICTAYDLYLQGEDANGYMIEIVKLNSSDGRVVYVTPTGDRYHFSKDCAGESAIETTYWDAVANDYSPCGKCAS